MHQPGSAVYRALKGVLLQGLHIGIVELQLADAAGIQVNRLLNTHGEQQLPLYIHGIAIDFSGDHDGLLTVSGLGWRPHLDGYGLTGRGANAQARNRQQPLASGAQVKQELSRLGALAVDDTGAARFTALQHLEIRQQATQVQRVEIFVRGGGNDQPEAVAEGHLLPDDSDFQRRLHWSQPQSKHQQHPETLTTQHHCLSPVVVAVYDSHSGTFHAAIQRDRRAPVAATAP